jgi:hypothetical protein
MGHPATLGSSELRLSRMRVPLAELEVILSEAFGTVSVASVIAVGYRSIVQCVAV